MPAARPWVLTAGALAAVLLACHAVSSVYKVERMKQTRRARLTGKACLAFVNVLYEPEGLRQHLYPWPDVVRARSQVLDQQRLLNPPLITAERLVELTAPGGANCGEITALSREGADWVARGWARLPGRDEPADAALFGYVTSGGERRVLALAWKESLPGALPYVRWERRFRRSALPAEAVTFTAWAYDAVAGRPLPCGSLRVLPEQW